MKEIKILYLYPDMLELYGDYGNIQVLKYRIEARGYKAIIDRYSIGDNAPNFNDYDIVFAGGGADNEQSILADDLVKYKDNIIMKVIFCRNYKFIAMKLPKISKKTLYIYFQIM